MTAKVYGGVKVRLFIAILLNEDIKEALEKLQKEMRVHCIAGNFTRKENFHLTLHFLGETTRLEAVKNAMDQVTASPFYLNVQGTGSFQRGGSEICWVGIEGGVPLRRLQKELGVALEKEGFPIESRSYRPHLTLGREIVFAPGHSKEEFQFPCQRVQVSEISLMESVRINGLLHYKERYKKSFS